MKCVKRLTADQQRLVEENLTIVERVLRFDISANPCVAGLGYEDLYQEGCVWLCNAALTFDPARGSFASYARRVRTEWPCRLLPQPYGKTIPHDSSGRD